LISLQVRKFFGGSLLKMDAKEGKLVIEVIRDPFLPALKEA